MAEYTSVIRVVIVTGAWRLSMHGPAWLRGPFGDSNQMSEYFTNMSIFSVPFLPSQRQKLITLFVFLEINLTNWQLINQYSTLWPVLAGTRAQSGDRYGSGTLHSGQVRRGSLTLLSPVFRRSHFRRQMPPLPQKTRALLVAKGGTVGENGVR
jgi:hypothetical protein